MEFNEDMILALAGQFKQLSHEPEKFRWLNGIRTHDLYDAGAEVKHRTAYNISFKMELLEKQMKWFSYN